MLRDAEAEVARLGEVLLAQLVFLDLEATLQDLLGLGTADGDVHGDLLVASDAETADGVAGFACCERRWLVRVFLKGRRYVYVCMMSSFLRSEFIRVVWAHVSCRANSSICHNLVLLNISGDRRTVDGGLTRELLEHFGRTGQSVTRLANGDVQDQLVDVQLAHGIGALVIAFRHLE
jgi:hypothetical protein